MTNLLFRLMTATALSCALAPMVQAQTAQVPSEQSEATKPTSQNVVLIADNVELVGTSTLRAHGNVEAVSGETRLQAREVIYDNETGEITLLGPIRITEGDSVSIVADSADLKADFQSGLIRSARLVLADQVQLAAQQLDRIGGRFNVLTKTTVSSCRICETGEAPLWQIRAKRVVHDQAERQIYFDEASFLIRDVPVFYFPHLRMPDPTLKRSKGFLFPNFRRTSLLGNGIKLPYFFPIGDDKDLTLTPYISTNTRTLEFRYRQAFENGGIELDGAISDDDLRPNETRGYLFAEGLFQLERDYKLTFDIKAVTDDAYISDYDYSDLDRLNSNIRVERASRYENTSFGVYHFRSLRDDEDNDTLPTLVFQAETERRYFPTSIGGELRTRLEAHSHKRDSGLDGDDGRDVARTNASVEWLRNWTLATGLRLGVNGGLAFDAYKTHDDTTVSSFDSGFTPAAAINLRYPLVKRGTDGATYLLEPVAQVGWTGGSNLDVANDESTRAEFDEGNLLSLSRFPSHDRRERGLAAALGMNWSRVTSEGWEGHFTVGQVFRDQSQSDFSATSGLAGKTSDLLLAGQFNNQNGLVMSARGLLDSGGTLNKAAARLGWSNPSLMVDASYIWLARDPDEDRAERISEWTLDSSYRFSRHWTGLVDWRYDAVAGKSARAGVGMQYRNECVQVELSLSRRFSTSDTVQSSNTFGINVALLGFSVNSNDKSYSRTCG
ncbi:LPS-assembly protein LptD [Shimia sp. MMG029]|uniref:LPS-assembly protein LptD n=1 Tax=Shimia sp. MMG029 TaxID=3021978 RepID=UPI0022FF2A0B|nr:LPS assembly protein LptD [Shimia sp. MMG029]MDA5555893.1 LPS assembly protein LptD [Shimia sp. MMG029]